MGDYDEAREPPPRSIARFYLFIYFLCGGLEKVSYPSLASLCLEQRKRGMPRSSGLQLAPSPLNRASYKQPFY